MSISHPCIRRWEGFTPCVNATIRPASSGTGSRRECSDWPPAGRNGCGSSCRNESIQVSTEGHIIAPLGTRMTRTNARPRRTAAPRSHPREFRQRNVPRKWRYRLAPAKRRPKGILTFWDRARRLLWSSVPWGMVFVWATWTHRLWGAIGSGLMAVFCHLIGQRERVPRYGLEHDFPVASTEFLNSVTGATGVPFSPGNRLEVLNNGDEFYPPMLEAIRAAQHSITIEAYIYWAGEIGLRFAEALAARAKSGVIVKILLDAIGSATIGEEILATLESGGCQVAWYNPIRWYTLERFNNRTHRKSLIIDGRIGFTGGAGIADHWLGCAQDAQHWRDVNGRF